MRQVQRDEVVGLVRAVFESLEHRRLMSAVGIQSGEVPWTLARAGGGAAPALEVSLTPAATDTQTLTPSGATARSPLGGNLNVESDRVQDLPFVDLVKTTRGFYNLAGRVASNGFPAFAVTDAQGWPREDFAFSAADNAEYGVQITPGLYRMSFTGPGTATVAIRRTAPGGAGTVPSTAPLPTLRRVSYNATTGLHTYDVSVPSGVRTLAFDFRRTGGQVRNVRVLQPGYSLTNTPTFTNEYLNLLRNLGPTVLRFKDWTHADNNLTSTWASRPQVTDATQARVTNPGDLQPAKGIAWEYVIQLANTLNTPVWVNVPIRATDDYVRQLANLLRTRLNPGLTIYVEYSNEVWNAGYEQHGYNLNQARAEVQRGGSNLNFDGSTNPGTWADRRYARRSLQIATIFRQVWEAAGQGNPLNNRVRVSLGGQVAVLSRFDNMLGYVNRVYGAPRNWFYSIGIAPYINLGGNQNRQGLTVDQVLASLNGSVNAYANGTALTGARSRAVQYGLRLQAYEGGIDTFGAASIAAKRAAMLDPRIQGVIDRYLRLWYSRGGGLFMWYTLGARSYNTPYGTWSLAESYGNFNQPKMIAFRQIRDAGLGQGQ